MIYYRKQKNSIFVCLQTINKMVLMLEPMDLEDLEHAWEYFEGYKANYGNEDYDFSDPYMFVSHALHSCQQTGARFYINDVEYQPVNMKDTAGLKPCNSKTQLKLLNGKIVALGNL